MALEAMLGMPDLSASHRERWGEAAFGGNVDPLLLDDMDVQLPPFVSDFSPHCHQFPRVISLYLVDLFRDPTSWATILRTRRATTSRSTSCMEPQPWASFTKMVSFWLSTHEPLEVSKH